MPLALLVHHTEAESGRDMPLLRRFARPIKGLAQIHRRAMPEVVYAPHLRPTCAPLAPHLRPRLEIAFVGVAQQAFEGIGVAAQRGLHEPPACRLAVGLSATPVFQQQDEIVLRLGATLIGAFRIPRVGRRPILLDAFAIVVEKPDGKLSAGIGGVGEMGEFGLCGGEIAALIGRDAGAKANSAIISVHEESVYRYMSLNIGRGRTFLQYVARSVRA